MLAAVFVASRQHARDLDAADGGVVHVVEEAPADSSQELGKGGLPADIDFQHAGAGEVPHESADFGCEGVASHRGQRQ